MHKSDFSWPDTLRKLIQKVDLTRQEANALLSNIMQGQATDVQVAAFITALEAKGVTAEEVAGMSETMIEYALPISVDRLAVDVVGTGGDGANTVNISTMSAIVTAASGRPVVKHGARASSSTTGSADLLEAFGIVIDLLPEEATAVFQETNITFCFAPVFHQAMKYVAPARKQLGIRTIFNYLGPLSNPAQPRAQTIGSADLKVAEIAAHVFQDRKLTAMIYRGEDGLDELTLSGPSRVWLVSGGSQVQTVLDPADLGLKRADIADIRGADATYNRAVAEEVFAGKDFAPTDAVLLNSAAALLAYDWAKTEAADVTELSENLVPQLRERLEEAREVLKSGKAAEKVQEWIKVSSKYRPTGK